LLTCFGRDSEWRSSVWRFEWDSEWRDSVWRFEWDSVRRAEHETVFFGGGAQVSVRLHVVWTECEQDFFGGGAQVSVRLHFVVS
jgi:hypothetical protein